MKRLLKILLNKMLIKKYRKHKWDDSFVGNRKCSICNISYVWFYMVYNKEQCLTEEEKIIKDIIE